MTPIIEGKYIYFKNFMLRKRSVFIAFTAILALVVFGIFYFATTHKTSEDKIIEAVKSGKTNVLDGVVKNINFSESTFILNVSRGLESKDFVMNVDKKTEFFVLELVEIQRPGALPEEVEFTEEYVPAVFDDIEINSQLQVYFADFIDVETTEVLMAEKINITGKLDPEAGRKKITPVEKPGYK